jgi:nucleotide-binding universal stress UspA family protein
VAETILQQTSQAGADLLVVGAYSRPRASEILFGGTTRSLIGEARIPMLMSG